MVTDQDSIPLSNKFGAVNSVGLSDSGDAIISANQMAMFRWQSSDGSRTRLLQVNDPAPEAPGSLNDVIGARRRKMILEMVSSPRFQREYVFVRNAPYDRLDRAVFLRRSYLL